MGTYNLNMVVVITSPTHTSSPSPPSRGWGLGSRGLCSGLMVRGAGLQGV